MPKDALTIAQRLEEEHLPTHLNPSWGDHKRAVSKQLARSALFHVADKRRPREQYKDTRMASWVRTEIRYTGEELRDDDHDVFMQLVHLMRKRELGSEVTIMGCDLLKLLEWGDADSDYERLWLCIKRLLEGTVWVYNPDNRGMKLYGSHLVHTVEGYDADATEKARLQAEGKITADEATRMTPQRTIWRLHLNKQLANIMADDSLTLIDWVRHLSLTPMAKWFHVFYSTHREPYAMSPKLFRELSGSKQKNLATFRQRIHKTLNELVEKGFLEGYTYNEQNDTFDVKRVHELVTIEKRGNGQLSLL